jgi:hypothetical protein
VSEPIKATILWFHGASRVGPASLTVRCEDGIVVELYVEHRMCVRALDVAFPGCIDDERMVDNDAIAGCEIYCWTDKSGLLMEQFCAARDYEDAIFYEEMADGLHQEWEQAGKAPMALPFDLDPSPPRPKGPNPRRADAGKV